MSHRMPYRRPIRVPLLLVRDETEYEAVAHCHYTPGRPAPHCSNHDDPRFSDPGDDEELDVVEIEGAPDDVVLTDEESAECMRWCAEYLDAMREAAADEAADRRRDDY